MRGSSARVDAGGSAELDLGRADLVYSNACGIVD